MADEALAAWFASLPDAAKRRIHMRPYEAGLSTCYHWEGTIRWRIEGEPLGMTPEAGTDVPEQPIKSGGTLARLMAAYGRWLRRRSDPRVGDIVALVRCPACRTPVVANADRSALACTACGRAYPVTDGIPRMVLDEAIEDAAP